MDSTKTITLDNVTYTMTPANAMASWNAIKNALALIKEIDLAGDVNDLGQNVIVLIASNLGNPAIKTMEDIVLSHTTASVSGAQAYRLSNDLDRHFNQFRSHLITILIEGVKYQFGDFFAGGSSLLTSMTPLSTSLTTAK